MQAVRNRLLLILLFSMFCITSSIQAVLPGLFWQPLNRFFAGQPAAGNR